MSLSCAVHAVHAMHATQDCFRASYRYGLKNVNNKKTKKKDKKKESESAMSSNSDEVVC